MTATSLRDRVRAHYRGRSLPPARLERLAALIEAGTPPRRRAPLLAGAVLLAAAAAALLLRDVGPGAATLAVAREIARGHTEGFQADLDATDIEALRLRMDSLDFLPVAPADLVPGATPLGAALGSLADHVAARFRILDADGRPATLVQARDRDAFAEVEERTVRLDGVSVRLWRRDGLLLGLAR